MYGVIQFGKPEASYLPFPFRFFIPRLYALSFSQLRGMYLRYGLAPIPQTGYLSGSVLRLALL